MTNLYRINYKIKLRKMKYSPNLINLDKIEIKKNLKLMNYKSNLIKLNKFNYKNKIILKNKIKILMIYKFYKIIYHLV